MGVPKCITEMHLLQDEQVLGAERMTRWDATAKVAVPHRHGESCPRREATPAGSPGGMGATECAHSSRAPCSASTARGLATRPGHAGGTPRHVGTVLEATIPASAKGTSRSP